MLKLLKNKSIIAKIFFDTEFTKNVNPACHDINQDIANYFDISETQAFDKSRENIIEVYNERIKSGFLNQNQ